MRDVPKMVPISTQESWHDSIRINEYDSFDFMGIMLSFLRDSSGFVGIIFFIPTLSKHANQIRIKSLPGSVLQLQCVT